MNQKETTQEAGAEKTDRDNIRAKQDRLIELAEHQGLPFDVPISECQNGAPTVLQLHSVIWPQYEPSIDSCLRFLESKEAN